MFEDSYMGTQVYPSIRSSMHQMQPSNRQPINQATNQTIRITYCSQSTYFSLFGQVCIPNCYAHAVLLVLSTAVVKNYEIAFVKAHNFQIFFQNDFTFFHPFSSLFRACKTWKNSEIFQAFSGIFQKCVNVWKWNSWKLM